MGIGSLNPFGDRSVVNPFGENWLGAGGSAGDYLGVLGNGLGLGGVPKIKPHELDPTGRNAAISMFGAQPVAVNAGGVNGQPIQVSSSFDQRGGNYDLDRNRQQMQLKFLGGAMRGRTPSVAEIQLQRGQEANMRQAYALANSGRGNATAAAMNAQNQGVIGGQQVNQQAAALRAGEMAQARQEYTQAAQSLAGQSMQQQQTGAQLGLQAGVANQGAGIAYGGMALQAQAMADAQRRAALAGLAGYDQMGMDNAYRPQEINAGIAAGNNQAKRDFWGNIIGAGAGIFMGGA